MSAIYPKCKEAWLGAGTRIDLDADDIRVLLVESTYTYSAAHQYVSDLGTNDNGRSAALGTKTITNGVFGAADTSLTATAALACNAIIAYKYNAADAAAELIAYIDS